MKKEKKNARAAVIVLGAVFAIIAIFIISGGASSIGNGISLGWMERKQGAVWSADYVSFTGTRKGSLHSEKDELLIEVETNGGSLEINVADTDGNPLFSEVVTKTASFRVDVPDRIDIEVTGKSHKGGFELKYK